VLIPNEWTFKDIEVAAEFDSHVREQLPWYDLASSAVAHIARHYIPDNGLVYDIGSSTGNMSRHLSDVLAARSASLKAIDNSAEMVGLYKGAGEVVNADALTFDYEKFDVAILFLVLMFFPASRRVEYLKGLVSKLNPGGCIIVLDKVSTNGGYISTVLHRLTMVGKVAAGCDMSEVTQKELSLGGVQRPIPGNFIPSLMLDSTEFFRFGEFAGWVIENPEA
jgi:tRNA (cmo5U34)-methyltransferase